MPDGITGITKMKENFEIAVPGIPDAIQIINELTGGSQAILFIEAVNQVHSVPNCFLLVV